MNILILGSGGREHVLAWKIAQSTLVDQLYIAPGNSGTEQEGINLNIDISDFEQVANAIKEHAIGMVVVGPEDPLVMGIKDYLQRKSPDVIVIGPNKKGAQLEGSKAFAKAFMFENNIPTARYESFRTEEIENAKDYLKQLKPPYVIKADGLAAGKGVIICETEIEAQEVLYDMLISKTFGSASESVVIEEFLKGIEVSFFILTDGENYLLFPEAKDYKRIGEGDTGPNTGGMGAISPVPFVNKEFKDQVIRKIIEPTLSGLKKRNISYSGFIFFGLMKVGEQPFVIEYNVRMGDPESQVVIPRIKNDLVPLLQAAEMGKLAEHQLKLHESTMTTVVLVSGGYPGSYEKGEEINMKASAADTLVFHAGAVNNEGKILTNGGRVLAVTGMGSTIKEALMRSYNHIDHISWKGMNFRKDIGFDLM